MALTTVADSARTHRLALCVSFFIQGLTFSSWASRIPDIKNMLHLSEAGLGGVLLALPAGQMMGMALSGFLVTRFGSKAMLSLAAVLYPLALTLIGLSASVAGLTAALVVFGLCGNLYNISNNTQAVGVEALYGRSIMASFHGVWSLAGFTGGLIGSLMVANELTPFQHYCLMAALAIPAMLLMRQSLLDEDASPRTGGEKSSFSIRPDKTLLVLGAIAFSCMICEGTMFDWSGVYFEKVVQVPRELTRVGFIAFMSTMAGGRFLADYGITRFGTRAVLTFSGFVILSGLLLAVILPDLVPATLGFLLVGIGVSSVVPTAYSLAGRSQSVASGVAIATVSTIGFLGFLLGPPVIGFIAEHFGLRMSFGVIAVLGLGTSFLARVLKS